MYNNHISERTLDATMNRIWLLSFEEVQICFIHHYGISILGFQVKFLCDYSLNGQIITSVYYEGILDKLEENNEDKRPELRSELLEPLSDSPHLIWHRLFFFAIYKNFWKDCDTTIGIVLDKSLLLL